MLINPIISFEHDIMLDKGVYLVEHFGGKNFLKDWDHYPSTSICPYGLCNHYSQVLDACPELEGDNRKYIVTVKKVEKEECGERWRYCGPMLGNEEGEDFFVYHIYERRRWRVINKVEKDEGGDTA